MNGPASFVAILVVIFGIANLAMGLYLRTAPDPSDSTLSHWWVRSFIVPTIAKPELPSSDPLSDPEIWPAVCEAAKTPLIAGGLILVVVGVVVWTLAGSWSTVVLIAASLLAAGAVCAFAWYRGTQAFEAARYQQSSRTD